MTEENELNYPSADEIHTIHEDIAAESDETESGIRKPEAVGSALIYISEGYFGERPETLHEKVAHLMRLIAAEHPYVDGNKRTALNTAESFYTANGYWFAYEDDEIRQWLRKLATDSEAVDMGKLVTYCRNHAVPIAGPTEE